MRVFTNITKNKKGRTVCKNIMGLNQKGHEKKTDQETQSPVMKLFQDMVHKDRNKKEPNPEKANLLNKKHTEKKRRHYSGHRAKNDQKPVETSSSEIRPYKEPEHHHEIETEEYPHLRTQSLPFQGEKRESWWFCSDDKKTPKNEETCSCVSCALKKLVTSDFACIGCLALLFSLSVIVGCLLVYKCMPTVTAPEEKTDRLKRKIDGINSWGSFLPKSLGLRTTNNYEFGDNPQNFNTIDAESELSNIFDDNKLNNMAGSVRLREFYKKLLKADAEIRRLKKNQNTVNLNTESKLYFPFYSEREKRSLKFKNPFHLFSFRKSTKKTDKTTTKATLAVVEPKAKPVIDNLSKSNNTRNKRLFNRTDDAIIFEKEKLLIQYNKPRKEKCSLTPTGSKLQSHERKLKHPFHKNSERFEELLDRLNKDLPKRVNEKYRFNLNAGNEKSLVKVPNIGEKATERVTDKIQFAAVGKNVKPIEFGNNFENYDSNLKKYKASFDSVDKNDNLKMYKTDSVIDNRKENLKANFEIPRDDKTKEYQRTFDNFDKNVNLKTYKMDYDIFRKMRNGSPNLAGTRTDGYAGFDVPNILNREQAFSSSDVLITAPTLPNLNIKRSTPNYNPIERMPNVRRLLQTEDEQEDVQYEDFKEVLTDDGVVHDDEYKQARRKRNENPAPEPNLSKYEQNKHHPPNINNPNWKGPMPLYPDEINSMMKHAPLSKGNKPTRGFIGKSKIGYVKEEPLEGESDTDYIESYQDFTFNRLVNLAQAYSDYGVLDGKKLAVTDRQDKVTDKSIDVIAIDDWKRVMKKRRNEYNATKAESMDKTDETEGIKIEIGRHSGVSKVIHSLMRVTDDVGEIFKLLDKKIKQTNDKQTGRNEEIRPVLVTASYDKDNPIAITGLSGIPKQYNDYTKDIYGLSIRKLKKIKDSDKPYDSSRYSNDQDKVLSPERMNQSYGINSDILLMKRSIPPFNNKNDYDLNEANTKLNMNNDKEKNDITNPLQGYDFNRMREVYNNNMNEALKMNDNVLFKKRSLKFFNDSNDFDDVSEANTKPNMNNKRKIDDKQRNLELLHEANDYDVSEVNKKNNDRKINDKILFKKRTLNSYNDSNDFYDISIANPRLAVSKNHSNAFNNTNEMLSEFFGMLAQIFNKFDNITDLTTENAVVNSDSDNITADDTSVENVPRASELADAMYDSDAVENIGHRSRVLLAINSTDEDKLSNISVEDTTAYLTELNLHLNSTSPSPRNNTAEKNKNKTVVKHNTKNTIFWNDIYDDEYGVRTEMIDNLQDQSGKHDFIKKSNDWIQDKVRRFGGNIFKGYKRINRSKPNDSLNRRVRDADDSNKRPDFTALTAHMREVCKRAVNAVRDSRQNDQEGKEISATNGLMKQLVGLMTELIDYQVQQKTCMKLPQDLHNFLEWLTDVSPDDHKDKEAEFLKAYSHDFTAPKEKSPGPPSESTSEREQPIEDLRSDCLGTLKSVQELLDTYDNLIDEDKSKMTGVKDYLLNQMKYLRSQISPEYVPKINENVLGNEYRYKRQLDLNPLKRKMHNRFLKNYSKKHTKTTANFYDGPTFIENLINKKEKRNLRDVYYKAVSEAKKTTPKDTNG